MTRRAPAPLLTAASIAGVEGLGVLGYGVALVPAVDTARLALGVTTPLFFLGYGVALAWFGWAIGRLRSWARAPLVLAQLLQLGVAWNFWGGSSTPVAVVLAVLALVVLAGIFHPASLEALDAEDAQHS